MAPRPRLGAHYCGVAASLILLGAAGWLILAPFAVAGQPYSGGWSPATANDVWCGVLLALVALARLMLEGRALVGLLRRERRPPGTGAILLLLLTTQLPILIALWLIAAPWLMQTQASGAPWSPGTVNDLVVGALVLATALGSAGATLLLAARQAGEAEHPSQP